jgi:hypothetical protein
MRTLFPLAAAALLAGAALAEPVGDCDSKGQPALGIVQVTGGSAGSTFYVDDRNYVTGNGIWFYQEDNGLWTEKPAGVVVGDPEHRDLQRGSWTCDPTPDDCEICYDWDPDLWQYGPDRLLL